MILVPLENGSRGDQIMNVESFKRQGWAEVVREGDLTPDTLVTAIQNAVQDLDGLKARLESGFDRQSSPNAILQEIESAITGRG